MDNKQKLDWIHKMTAEALAHAKATPNVPTPDGKMSHDKMAAFVSAQTKHGLQHLDAGGPVAVTAPGTTLAGPGPAAGNTPSTTQAGPAGAVNSVLGLTNNFVAQGANIQAGTNAAQLNAAYTGAQSGLAQEQGVANTLTPGVAQGAGAESTVVGQLANEAAGQGPNPAQAALNQSTGNNIAQTAALIAGQRGAGANAGAAAVGAAQTGAQTQQTAVGQAATLQAQQELAAQQEEANVASNQVTQGTNAVTGVNQTQQNEQNILQGANTSANNAAVAMQSNINNVNAGISTANQNMNANTTGGLLAGASAVSSLFAKGGLVRMDKGGNVLDVHARQQIAPDNFALPGRRYPIHDISHARNALARVSQHGTPAEKSKVKAAVHKKYPSLAGKKMADGGDVQADDNSVAFTPTSSDTSSGPQVASSAALPADTTNFAQIVTPSQSSGGSSGGGGLSSLAGLAALMAKGGEVKHSFMKMASGGYVPPQSLSPGGATGPQSFVGQFVNTPSNVSAGPNVGSSPALPGSTTNLGTSVDNATKSKPKAAPAGATDQELQDADESDTPAPGAVPSADLPGGPMKVAYRGGLAAQGGNVKAGKGQKAVKPDDSLSNDKIPTMLSEDEIVLPRSVTTHPMAPEKAAEFVRRTLANRKRK
jgi:hypothetical protein